MPRTPPEDFARLFNFAGGGIIHINLFIGGELTVPGPTWLELITEWLLPVDTIANRPAATDVPAGSLFFASDTGAIYQARSGAWVSISTGGGGGTPGGSDKALQYNNASAFGGVTLNATATKKYLQQVSSGTPTLEQVSGADLIDATVTEAKQLLADNTTGNVSTTKHGYAPKAPNDATKYLDGTGNYSVPAGGTTPGLILLSSTIVTAAAQTVTISGLDGDAHANYLLLAKIANGANAAVLYDIRPNGLTTNQTAVWETLNTGGRTNNTGSIIYLGGAPANAWCTIECLIHAAKTINSISKPRAFTSRAEYPSTTFTFLRVGGMWNETSTNLTSIDVHCDTANGIGDGSRFDVYYYG